MSASTAPPQRWTTVTVPARQYPTANESLKLPLDEQRRAPLVVMSADLPEDGLQDHTVQYSMFRGAARIGSRHLVGRHPAVSVPLILSSVRRE
jgi:hypothetical protein